MPMDGGPEVNLTETPGQHEIGPSYSPNGQYLVYERRPNFELVVSAPDGSDPRVLIAPVGLGNFPWSPDGSSVAVDASVGGQTGLVVIPVVGNPRLVSPPGEPLAIVSEIDWSPDGNRLAYAAFESPTSDVRGIFVINADGTGRRQVSPPGVNAYRGTWMPAE
jgi:Tol biopolymer transport system component